MPEAVIKGEARAQVETSPEKVWELVSDITRTGEYSPENTGGEWIDGATGPAVGARFKGKNRKGWMRWSTKCFVTECEPGRVFEFAVGKDRADKPHWRYTTEPSGTGTALTESYAIYKYGLFYRILIKTEKRRAELDEGIRQTVQRIKAAAEGSVPPA